VKGGGREEKRKVSYCETQRAIRDQQRDCQGGKKEYKTFRGERRGVNRPLFRRRNAASPEISQNLEHKGLLFS